MKNVAPWEVFGVLGVLMAVGWWSVGAFNDIVAASDRYTATEAAQDMADIQAAVEANRLAIKGDVK